MRAIVWCAVLVAVVPSVAMAHVTVRPRESKAAAEERYVVRVPTEGSVATTQVQLDVPEGVVVTRIEEVPGATIEPVRRGERIVAIVWRHEIKPKDAAEFAFYARNPVDRADIAWRAHQHFADGTVADWVGPAGDRRPASVTQVR